MYFLADACLIFDQKHHAYRKFTTAATGLFILAEISTSVKRLSYSWSSLLDNINRHGNMLICGHAPRHDWVLQLILWLLASFLLASQCQEISSDETQSDEGRQAFGAGSTQDNLKAKLDQQHYSALCVIAKNENRYLREWLQYHRCLGEWYVSAG